MDSLCTRLGDLEITAASSSRSTSNSKSATSATSRNYTCTSATSTPTTTASLLQQDEPVAHRSSPSKPRKKDEHQKECRGRSSCSGPGASEDNINRRAAEVEDADQWMAQVEKSCDIADKAMQVAAQAQQATAFLGNYNKGGGAGTNNLQLKDSKSPSRSSKSTGEQHGSPSSSKKKNGGNESCKRRARGGSSSSSSTPHSNSKQLQQNSGVKQGTTNTIKSSTARRSTSSTSCGVVQDDPRPSAPSPVAPIGSVVDINAEDEAELDRLIREREDFERAQPGLLRQCGQRFREFVENLTRKLASMNRQRWHDTKQEFEGLWQAVLDDGDQQEQQTVARDHTESTIMVDEQASDGEGGRAEKTEASAPLANGRAKKQGRSSPSTTGKTNATSSSRASERLRQCCHQVTFVEERTRGTSTHHHPPGSASVRTSEDKAIKNKQVDDEERMDLHQDNMHKADSGCDSPSRDESCSLFLGAWSAEKHESFDRIAKVGIGLTFITCFLHMCGTPICVQDDQMFGLVAAGLVHPCPSVCVGCGVYLSLTAAAEIDDNGKIKPFAKAVRQSRFCWRRTLAWLLPSLSLWILFWTPAPQDAIQGAPVCEAWRRGNGSSSIGDSLMEAIGHTHDEEESAQQKDQNDIHITLNQIDVEGKLRSTRRKEGEHRRGEEDVLLQKGSGAHQQLESRVQQLEQERGGESSSGAAPTFEPTLPVGVTLCLGFQVGLSVSCNWLRRAAERDRMVTDEPGNRRTESSSSRSRKMPLLENLGKKAARRRNKEMKRG
ncbi:unnamed protein product [Amoebophrya sp. A25]|nr:unnamed protein product [Amoebophrya sp. A25]|eukprot:GSA25T00024047001.1